jgi:hypothetical protein
LLFVLVNYLEYCTLKTKRVITTENFFFYE